jgi:uncharacterized membrane protein
MSAGIGIGLAFVAMLCWGFGDFMIQRSTRKVGDWETLFAITLFGSAVLLPFTYRNIPALLSNPTGLLVLSGCAVILFGAALLDFEALRIGKLSVVEPIWSFEIPAAALLALLVIGEQLSLIQSSLIGLLIVGLVLVSFKGRLSAKMLLEKGVRLAFVAALAMGTANFLMGWGARETDPLMVNFFVNVFIAVGSGVYLAATGKFRKMLHDLRVHRSLLLPMSVLDNAAWVAFAFAMTLVPIGVAVALSESYIIVAVLLGIFVNRERLYTHQKFGLIAALAAALVLAVTTA